MTTDLPVGIRPGVGDDLDYVLPTWEKHCPHPGVKSRDFIDEVLNPILGREETVLRIAHAPGDPDAIIGFMIAELAAGPVPPLVLHVYVRKPARRRGVARRLLADLDSTVDVVQLPPFALPRRFRLNPNRWPST